jgi:hypothetical protein
MNLWAAALLFGGRGLSKTVGAREGLIFGERTTVTAAQMGSYPRFF